MEKNHSIGSTCDKKSPISRLIAVSLFILLSPVDSYSEDTQYKFEAEENSHNTFTTNVSLSRGRPVSMDLSVVNTFIKPENLRNTFDMQSGNIIISDKESEYFWVGYLPVATRHKMDYHTIEIEFFKRQKVDSTVNNINDKNNKPNTDDNKKIRLTLDE